MVEASNINWFLVINKILLREVICTYFSSSCVTIMDMCHASPVRFNELTIHAQVDMYKFLHLISHNTN